MTEDKAPRLAAAAPADDDNAPDLPFDGGEDVDQLLEQWNHWRTTRRFYAPAPTGGNLLGKLRGSTRPSRLPPDASCSANMAALHLAIIGQPRDALDVRVFWLYYCDRVANIKCAAEALGMSRSHFYRLRDAAVRSILITAKQIEAANLAAGDALPHRAAKPSVGTDQ
jgi:hypothetical protein